MGPGRTRAEAWRVFPVAAARHRRAESAGTGDYAGGQAGSRNASDGKGPGTEWGVGCHGLALWRLVPDAEGPSATWGPQALAAPQGLPTAPCLGHVLSPGITSAEGLARSVGAGAPHSCPTALGSCLWQCPTAAQGQSGQPSAQELPVPAEPTAAGLGSQRAAMGDAAGSNG